MWHWSQGLCMTMNLWNIQCALIFLNVQNKFFALLAVAPGNHLVHGIYNKTIFWSHTLVLFCITYIAYLCLIPFCKIMKHGIQYQDSKDLVRFVCFSFYLFSKPIDLFGKVDQDMWSLNNAKKWIFTPFGKITIYSISTVHTCQSLWNMFT